MSPYTLNVPRRDGIPRSPDDRIVMTALVEQADEVPGYGVSGQRTASALVVVEAA